MRRIVTLSVGLLLLVGCGPKAGSSGELNGKITYKGQPVGNATLQLIPAEAKGQGINIPVNQEGVFRTTGLLPGGYKIVVQGTPKQTQAFKMTKDMTPEQVEKAKAAIAKMAPPAPETITFPDKYKNPTTTPLSCNITGTKQDLPLELTD